MTEGIVISKMTPEDTREVIDIGLDTPEVLIDPNNPYYYDEEALKKFTGSSYGIALVAKKDSKVVGFIIVYLNLEMGDAYFSDIAILNDYRNYGIGKMLYEKATEVLHEKKCRWIWAICEEDNKGMQKFFDKRDFKRGRKYYFQYKTLS